MIPQSLYIDLDNVLADFNDGVRNHPLAQDPKYKGQSHLLPNIYLELKPVYKAKDAIQILNQSEKLNCFILSTSPWDYPEAWMHKRLWVEKHFDQVFRKKLILSHRKDLLKGDYLIDDSPRNGAKDFDGVWLQFGNKEFPDWESILNYFRESKLI